MSELIQSGQHPDADQLSAFVEHALPPHEHEQMLAHLAVCPDCRTIVAFSLPPLDESPTPQPEPARRPWLSGWILAWPVAAALAGLAFFLIHLHNAASSKGNITAPTQIATTHPPTPLPAQNVPPDSVSTPPSPPLVKALPPTGVGAAPRLAKPLISGTSINGHQPIGAVPIEGRSSSTLPQAQAAGGAGTISGQLALHGTAVGRAQSRSAMTAESSPQPNFFTAGNASGTALSPSPAKTPTTATPSNPATASSAPASKAMDALSADADTNASATTLAKDNAAMAPTATPAFTLKATQSVALPSSLPAISTATNGARLLAIDTQNSLFYSEDSGKHWSAIAAPWRGRAVKVTFARPANSAAAATNSLTTSGFGATGGPITVPPPTTGTTLAGTITDATGAVISGASVTVSNTATKTARTVQTDRNGHYLADNLTPGSYQIEATAPGFSKQQLAAVTVAAAQQNQANLTLTVGSASEAVTVETSASTIPLATAPAPRLAPPRAALKRTAPPATVHQPGLIFEITTENGDRWTSPDGKTWTQK